jgi:hypothetical protein
MFENAHQQSENYTLRKKKTGRIVILVLIFAAVSVFALLVFYHWRAMFEDFLTSRSPVQTTHGFIPGKPMVCGNETWADCAAIPFKELVSNVKPPDQISGPHVHCSQTELIGIIESHPKTANLCSCQCIVPTGWKQSK